ncbi:protein PLANT CADMIUM RESISTANCE 10 [Lingula anatina]|uniref:Protein PLANT CADMIUM RESISTANCE 10 n=1 Tax=Lingula anatina TaxID=7574 RepID=A0A1S3H579_LINAN|nr:protein PLANT CADMIUM RESISTANCE 10 [Lingula anatina]XP_013381123.1 protein PLANT CADMIUM RESISTANCE 10 [Lingula anatina]|eukprot:XP_013381122.1 protein PLANT CADMIUM RESISTANCE 10 [Lingula anatina]
MPVEKQPQPYGVNRVDSSTETSTLSSAVAPGGSNSPWYGHYATGRGEPLAAHLYAAPSMQQYIVTPPYLTEASSAPQRAPHPTTQISSPPPVSTQPKSWHNSQYSTETDKEPRPWNSGMCQCCDGTNACCAICCCLVCFECWMADRMKEGCCMPWCVPFSTMSLRLKMRMMYNIQGSILGDFCASLFCKPCILCQMKRELDHMEAEEERLQMRRERAVSAL